MAVERRGQVTKARLGQRETGGAHGLAGERQLSAGGTSRMNREVHVRICEGLGVQLPGPTRRDQHMVVPIPRQVGLRIDSRLPVYQADIHALRVTLL
jgi:hypothetical protein